MQRSLEHACLFTSVEDALNDKKVWVLQYNVDFLPFHNRWYYDTPEKAIRDLDMLLVMGRLVKE